MEYQSENTSFVDKVIRNKNLPSYIWAKYEPNFRAIVNVTEAEARLAKAFHNAQDEHMDKKAEADSQRNLKIEIGKLAAAYKQYGVGVNTEDAKSKALDALETMKYKLERNESAVLSRS